MLRAFLNLNGYDFELTEDEFFDLAIGVATSSLAVDDVENRLRPITAPV